MVKGLIQKIIAADNAYGGVGMMLALYFVCFLFLYFYGKNEKIKKSITIPSILIIVFLYMLVPLMDVLVMPMDYYDGRFFWMLMTPIVTALGLSLFVKGISDKKNRIFAIIVIIPIIFYCGKFSISNAMYSKAENSYRLPQTTVDITDYVLSKKENPLLVVPYTIAHPFRQITTKVRLLYGEDASEARIYTAPDELFHICWEMEKTIPDLNRIINEGAAYNPDYILFDTVYTEFCENGNINVDNYPADKNYVGDRTPLISYEDIPGISVVGTKEEPYWDLSAYGLSYEAKFGQYVLYSYNK